MSFFLLTAKQSKTRMFAYLFYLIQFFYFCLFAASASFFFFARPAGHKRSLK